MDFVGRVASNQDIDLNRLLFCGAVSYLSVTSDTSSMILPVTFRTKTGLSKIPRAVHYAPKIHVVLE